MIKSLLQSIHDELETLWNVYQKEMGTYLESLPENKPLLNIYVITHDYFTIYHGNSFLIGKIKNNDLRKRIITTYTIAKGLIDSYRLNNELVQKYEQLNFWYKQTYNQAILKELKTLYDTLVDYAKEIKKQHYEAKNNINVLLKMLRKSFKR